MRMKRTFALLLSCALLPTAAFAASVPSQPEIQVFYNQKQLAFPDQKPVIRNSRTLVPIRPIAEGLGFKVDWNNQARLVSIVKASNSVSLVINQKTAKRNGQAINLDTPAQIINGRTMVPVRFIAEALNYQVNWNAAEHKVLISDNSIYAKLGNVTLTQEEADKYFKVITFVKNKTYDPILQKVVKQITSTEALYGKYLVDKYGKTLKVSEAELEQGLANVKAYLLKRYNNSQEALNKEMAAAGITEQDIRQSLYYELFTETYVKSTITPQEVQDYYQKHPELYTVASVRHILVDTLDEANTVISRLSKGEKFADLAKALSKDPGSKDNGGLYENVEVKDWVKEFREAALTQPIGKVGQPVKTQFGYHVILVESRSVLPFQQVEQQVNQDLLSEKTKQLRSEAFKNN